MNYAQKELRKVVLRLAEAYAAKQALKQILRTLEMGGPVEIRLRSPRATAAVLCPAELGSDLLAELIEQAEGRMKHLLEQEASWFKEVALLAQKEDTPPSTV